MTNGRSTDDGPRLDVRLRMQVRWDHGPVIKQYTVRDVGPHDAVAAPEAGVLLGIEVWQGCKQIARWNDNGFARAFSRGEAIDPDDYQLTPAWGELKVDRPRLLAGLAEMIAELESCDLERGRGAEMQDGALAPSGPQ